MAEICPICGLPKDICVCGEISREQEKIVVRREIRRYRKAMTIIEGVNDNSGEIERTADFLAQLKPNKAYLAIPTRPPAKRTINAASEQTINMAYQIFGKRLTNVEYFIGYEGNAFAFSGNAEEDLLSITSVHPMREEAVAEFLKRAGTGWDTVQDLIENRSLVELKYQGKKFYIRKLPVRSVPTFE